MSLFKIVDRKPLPEDYHHPLSASKGKRWLKCPASTRVPDSVGSNDAAAFGTKVHNYAERLSRGLAPAELNIDPAALKAAREYLDAIQPFLADCDEVHTELRVYLDGVPVMLWDTLSGTADKVGVTEFGPLVVADLKTGYVDVEVEDNEQLDFYSLGAYENLLPEVQATITHIIQIIVQVNGRVGCQVKQTTKSVEDLLAFRDRVSTAVDKAEITPDVFVAGEHCTKSYCPIALKCKAHLQYMESTIGTEITELDPEDVVADVALLEKALDALPLVKAWCKAVEAQSLQQALTTPDAFTHYHLVASFGHRAYIDELAFAEAAKKAGVSDLIYDKKLKTPATLEKIPFVKELINDQTVYRPSNGHNLKKV